jgi:hypothetical protein
VEDFIYERQAAVNRWRISRCVDAAAGAAGAVPAH